MESLATATNAVSTNNTNSNSSSSSSGYGSATTTPLGHYESHVATPENAAIPTSPSPAASSSAPTAVATTIATVAPYAYSEPHTIADGHRQQYQYTAYNYPPTTSSNILQTSNSQQHNPYVGLNYMQHTASAAASNDYSINEQTTKERSSQSISENSNTTANNNSNNIIKHATHSPIEKLTAYANLSSTSQHVAGNSAYKQNSAHLPSIADMPSKPQATATPFYATPVPRVTAAGYYDQYKFKMPTTVGAEYANYGCRIPGNSTTYQQQQQQYYAAAKSQLSEVNYGTAATKPLSPTTVMRQQMSSLYGRSNTAAAAYYDKYEKYGSYTLPPPTPTNPATAATASNMSLPTNDTTGATTYTTLHPSAAASHYSAAEAATGGYRKASATNWHWNMDYVTGNYRTLPPPPQPPPPTAIPTAAIPPSNASYLSPTGQTGTSAGTRDAYYSKFDKYNAYAYHQQQQHQQQQQQQQQQHQQPAAATSRNIWTAPTHQHMGTTITERLPHPTAAYQPPPPPYAPHHFAATAANVAATRQNCCTQSSAYHQQQSCYYPRVPTQHVSNVYPPHPHAHSHPTLQHAHSHHLQQNSQHYGSNKYVTNSILDYPMQSKLKYANTDLMTAAAAMPYDAAATYSNYNYAAATQRFAAGATQHNNLVSDSATTAAAAYYNDLNLQSTYENYATTAQQHSTQQQQQQQQQHTHQYQHHGASTRAQHLSYHHPPPPQSNHVKNPLLDYRKPANTTTAPPPPPPSTGTTIMDNCYMQESVSSNYHHHNYENSATATSLYAIDAANDHDPDAEKSGITKNHLSIRDFIATWNDDEEDAAAVVAATEFNYVESAQSQKSAVAANAAGGPTADNHVKILHTETIPATQKHYLHEQQQQQQQQHYTPPLENHLQFKGSFSTRPKIHVGITVDSSVDTQYINLPDIIIDIEKANNAGGVSSGGVSSTVTTSSFENFDVEKELDELQIKKSKLDIEKQIVASVAGGEHMKCNNDNSALRMRSNIESVEANDTVVNKHTFKGVLDATKPSVAALSKTDVGPHEEGVKIEAGQHHFETPEQLLKEMEYDSTSLSNESTFEKEYETFINKIGTDVQTQNIDEKLTAGNLRQGVEEEVKVAVKVNDAKEEENAIVPSEANENTEAKELELKNNEIANAKNEAELEEKTAEDNVTLNVVNTNDETKSFNNITEIGDKIDSLKDESKVAGDVLLEEAKKEDIAESVANAAKESKETLAELVEIKALNENSADLNMHDIVESETATESQKSPKYSDADLKTEEINNKTVESNMNSVAKLEINHQQLTASATSALNTSPLIEQTSHNHKFYKRKRKLIDDANNEELHCTVETAPAPLQNNSSKRVATAAEKKQMYEQNFPIVYTKNCRKRKFLTATTTTTTTNVAVVATTIRATNFQNKQSRQVFVNQQHRRKPKSLYYKMLHKLRLLRSSNLMRQFSLQQKRQQQQQKRYIDAAAAAAVQKERHLPLIKRQSIKKYAIANSAQYTASSYFNPKTLKSLSVSILNTEKFRQRVFPSKIRGININLKKNFQKNICGAVEEVKTEVQDQTAIVSRNVEKCELLKTTDTEIACNMASQVIESNDIVAELVQTKEVSNQPAESNMHNIIELKQELITTIPEEVQKSPKHPTAESEAKVVTKQTESDMQHEIDDIDNQLIVDKSNCVAEETKFELAPSLRNLPNNQAEFEDVPERQHDLNAGQSNIIDNFSFKETELNEDENSVIYSKEQKIVYDYSSSTSSEEEIIDEIHSIDKENTNESNAVLILKNENFDDNKIFHDNIKNDSNCENIINKIESETFDDASSSSSSSSSESDTTNDTDSSSSSSSDDNDTDIDADDDTTSSTTTTTSSDESDLNEMLALERELSSTQYATAIEKTVKTHQHDIENIVHDNYKVKSIDQIVEAEKQKTDITKKQITRHDIANLKKVLEGAEENEELLAKENNEIMQKENNLVEVTEMRQLQNENDVIEIPPENVASKQNDESEKSVEFVERRPESVQQQQFLTEIPSLRTLAKTVVDEKLLAMAVENFTIPKLSDLCKNALSSSCIENFTTTTTLLMLNTTDNDDFHTLLDENVITAQQQEQQIYIEHHGQQQQQRELSVEEALAEMYRQAGVASDPEDFGETDGKAAQEVLLINLEEILVDSDSDNLYVLQCDMNENILGVITQTTENNDENVEQVENDIAGNSNRVNTLELVELFHEGNIKETTPNNNISIINTNDNLIISTANDPIPIKFLQSSPTSPDPDYNPSSAFIVDCEFKNSTNIEGNFMHPPQTPPASISTTSTNLPPVSDSSVRASIDDDVNEHNDDYDADIGAHFDLPTIHHEEIVPDNYKSYQNEKFLKYLHAKYVQKNISKFYHANRIIKKYKKRLIRKLINVMEVDKNSRCVI